MTRESELAQVAVGRVEQSAVQAAGSIFPGIRGYTIEYGMHTKEDLIHSMDRSLVKRKRPLVVAILGETSSSKTLLGKAIAEELFGFGEMGETETAKLIRETGEDIPVRRMSWGEILMLLWLEGKTEGKVFGEFTKKDNEEKGNERYAKELAQTIREGQGRRELILAEGGGATGAWLNEDPKRDDPAKIRSLGTDRSLRAFWKLVSRLGPFSGLDLEVCGVAVGADPEIRDVLGKKLRKASVGLLKNPDPAKVKNALKKAHMEFDPKSLTAVIRWLRFSANPRAIRSMEGETNDLIEEMVKLGILWVDLDKLKTDPRYRSEIVVTGLLRYAFERYLKIEKVFLANNYDVVERLRFETHVPIRDILADRYSEFAKLAAIL